MTRAFAGEARVRAFRTPNGGKSAALNFGLRHTTAPIVVALDADTVFSPDTVRLLAAASRIRASARSRATRRWATASTCSRAGRRSSTSPARTSIGVRSICSTASRSFRARSGRGGASSCSTAGGFSTDTLAEDADLTMAILRQGYDVVYEDARARLDRGARHGPRAPEAALPLGVRHAAGGVEAA